MSLRSWLTPVISQHLLSRGRLLKRRADAERTRVKRGEPHRVHYFHQVDDPYSALVASILPRFAARYDIDIAAHVVGPPPDAAAPERQKLIDYSRKDAALLARHWDLKFDDPGRQPALQESPRVTEQLVTAAENGTFVALAGTLSASLWSGVADSIDAASILAPQTSAHLDRANALRKHLGHYLGATFYYEGEWYWGVDRLHHLERRLQELGAARGGIRDLMFPPDPDLKEVAPLVKPEPIDFFFSLRSPYSAIAAPRVFELAGLTGAKVRLRYLLPMVMRGLPVPPDKRSYISQDAAREAFVRGIPFGRLNDPVGRPTERGLALMAYAERVGKGQDYLLSFMRGVWAEGIDAGSDRGLRKIVERCGLSWQLACLALKDESWREVAELNREEMFALGLWGVPSFKVGDTVVWGQDRLWAVQLALLKREPSCAAE
jgi:2-hydroxychromene-2-carboxylate isomerase